MIRVLFVCMGNICRSPTAQGVAEVKAKEMQVEHRFEFDSAGTHAYHVGEHPDPRSCYAAGHRGIDITQQKSRKISEGDFSHFDYILVMDEANYQAVQAVAPEDAQSQLIKIMDFSNLGVAEDVPDPYYGGRHGFEQVLDLLDNAVDGFLKHALADRPNDN